MFDAKHLISEILELIREAEIYENYKESLAEQIKEIETAYQKGGYGYLEYETKLKSALRDKSRQGWDSYYNAYIFSLLKKIDYLISEVYAKAQELPVEVERKSAKLPEVKAEIKKLEAKRVVEKTEEKKAIEEESVIAETRWEQKINALRARLNAPHKKVIIPETTASPEFKAALDKIEKRLEEKPVPRIKADVKAKPEKKITKDKFKLPTLDLAKRFSFLIVFIKRMLASVKSVGGIITSIHLPAPKEKAKKVAKEKPTTHYFATLNAFLKKTFVENPATAFSAFSRTLKKAFAIKLPSFKLKLFEKKKAVASPKPQAKKVAKPTTPIFSAIFHTLKETFKLKLFEKNKKEISTKKRALFVEEIVGMEHEAKKKLEEDPKGGGVIFGWFLGKGLLKELMKRFRAKEEPIMAEETRIPTHVKKLRELREKLYETEQMDGFEATLLAQEAKRVKNLMETEKPEVYKGSSLGVVANVTVKKASVWLVDTFPEFFGFLYNALRAANIKILSNTYVNIMILCTTSLFFGVFVLLNIIFFVLNDPIYQIILKSTILSFVAAGLCATIFYLYPFMKIKERRRSMNTNMPFAINHLASVSASGVPPATMFELISQSKEYGEITIEIKKIVDFTNIFGYDLLTALRSVAATTPSVQFKEFLEGMVSTIETGGDLESYLTQKAEEASTHYQLERQRYNESISTYSDVYTGLLIAAPLFFIAALSLINMLGGTIGGLGVDTVMALAAYLLIPVLNIAFLVFLQASQPEV